MKGTLKSHREGRTIGKGFYPGLATEFRTLFEKHYATVVRRLTYLTGERTSAEDLAQEAFFKLYQTPPADLRNPGGWLNRVAGNLALNYLRGEKRRRIREEEIYQNRELISSIDDTVLRNRQIQMVRDVLDALTERDRLLLLLRHSGSSYEEIAGVIGVEKSSIGTLLARAQQKFRQEYNRLNGGTPDEL